jgi:tetratricopeptide (TPR) repeat protein
MAYRRDLDAALDYFRQAARAEPELADAHEGIAWLQTARSLQDLNEDNAPSAWARLTEARAEIVRADQTGARVQAFAGYIAQHAADAAERLHQDADAQRLRAEALGTFEQAARRFPDDPSVLNGLAGSYVSLGDYDGAIRSYERVIKLAAEYPQAFHDLAVAYEGKRGKDSAHASQWCKKAIAAWKEFVRLAPSDPTIAEEYVNQISRRILTLESECAPAKPGRKNKSRP